MNIIRTVRRTKFKFYSLIIVIVFISNTYAWFVINKGLPITGLTGQVKTWDVEFFIEDKQITTETYDININDIYPGMEPIEKKIYSYNTGESSTTIEYEVKSINFLGKEITPINTVGEEQRNETTGITTVNIFGNPDSPIYCSDQIYGNKLIYPTPFSITYEYDIKEMLPYNETNPPHACLKLKFAWENNELNNEEDTKIGELAYKYKNEETSGPSLRITVKIIATKKGEE